MHVPHQKQKSASEQCPAQVGLPLVVHERFLAAYDFMPRNAVIVAGVDGDAGAMHTLLTMSASQLEDKLMNVRSLPQDG